MWVLAARLGYPTAGELVIIIIISGSGSGGGGGSSGIVINQMATRIRSDSQIQESD